jgi:hypothetical protein
MFLVNINHLKKLAQQRIEELELTYPTPQEKTVYFTFINYPDLPCSKSLTSLNLIFSNSSYSENDIFFKIQEAYFKIDIEIIYSYLQPLLDISTTELYKLLSQTLGSNFNYWCDLISTTPEVIDINCFEPSTINKQTLFKILCCDFFTEDIPVVAQLSQLNKLDIPFKSLNLTQSTDLLKQKVLSSSISNTELLNILDESSLTITLDNFQVTSKNTPKQNKQPQEKLEDRIIHFLEYIAKEEEAFALLNICDDNEFFKYQEKFSSGFLKKFQYLNLPQENDEDFTDIYLKMASLNINGAPLLNFTSSYSSNRFFPQLLLKNQKFIQAPIFDNLLFKFQFFIFQDFNFIEKNFRHIVEQLSDINSTYYKALVKNPNIVILHTISKYIKSLDFNILSDSKVPQLQEQDICLTIGKSFLSNSTQEQSFFNNLFKDTIDLLNNDISLLSKMRSNVITIIYPFLNEEYRATPNIALDYLYLTSPFNFINLHFHSISNFSYIPRSIWENSSLLTPIFDIFKQNVDSMFNQSSAYFLYMYFCFFTNNIHDKEALLSSCPEWLNYLRINKTKHSSIYLCYSNPVYQKQLQYTDGILKDFYNPSKNPHSILTSITDKDNFIKHFGFIINEASLTSMDISNTVLGCLISIYMDVMSNLLEEPDNSQYIQNLPNLTFQGFSNIMKISYSYKNTLDFIYPTFVESMDWQDCPEHIAYLHLYIKEEKDFDNFFNNPCFNKVKKSKLFWEKLKIKKETIIHNSPFTNDEIIKLFHECSSPVSLIAHTTFLQPVISQTYGNIDYWKNFLFNSETPLDINDFWYYMKFVPNHVRNHSSFLPHIFNRKSYLFSYDKTSFFSEECINSYQFLTFYIQYNIDKDKIPNFDIFKNHLILLKLYQKYGLSQMSDILEQSIMKKMTSSSVGKESKILKF